MAGAFVFRECLRNKNVTRSGTRSAERRGFCEYIVGKSMVRSSMESTEGAAFANKKETKT